MATRSDPSRTRPGRPRRAPLPVGRAVQDIETNFDRDYWLAHCEGYRVDAEDAQVALIVPRLERIWLSGPVRVVESEAFEPGPARSRSGRRDTTSS